MKKIFYLLFSLYFISCSGGSKFDLEGYETIPISGTDAKMAVRKDDSGKVVEKGIIRNDVKDGIWMTYYDNDRVKSIASYVGGKLNGTYFEFNNRGQIDYEADYLDEKFNGVVANYKFGRLEQTMSYSDGELDGPFSIYTERGKLQRKGSFKKGKQDGVLQYFDDDENLIMEYQYKDGEKISGGIVQPEKDTIQ